MDLLSIISIIVIGLVGYMYWLQGLLSGFLSAVLAVFSACLAAAYYEPLATALGGGKFNDQAHGVCLIAIFALSFLILRIIFDSLVPGNIRVAAIADKVGGAVFGVVTAIFAMGIVAIGAQYFPFGPSIGGYSRYPLAKDERTVNVPAVQGPQLNRMVYDELKGDDLEGDPNHLLIPVDDMVVGMVSHLSNGGALDNARPFKSIHPDLLQELFGQRIGRQVGSRATATNKKSEQVRIDPIVYVLPNQIERTAAEYTTIRDVDYKKPLVARPGTALIAITVSFDVDAADELEGDRFARLGTGAVRLVAKVGDEWKNFFPLGTLQNGKVWINKPDDFLLFKVSSESRGAHFVFDVPDSLLPKRTGKRETIQNEDMFVEVKRMVQASLSGAEIKHVLDPRREPPMWKDSRRLYPVRKAQFFDETKDKDPTQVASKTNPDNTTPPDNPPKTNDTPKPPDNPPDNPPTPPSSENGWDQAPLEKPAFTVSDRLPIGINIGSADADAMVENDALTASTEARKFTLIETKLASPNSAVTQLSKGTNLVQQLAAPKDMRIVQVKLTPRKPADGWAWAASPGDYTVSDGDTQSFRPRGVVAEVTAGGARKLFVKYDQGADLTNIAAGQGTVSSVTLLYHVPKNVKAKELRYQSKPGGLPLEK